MSRTVFYQYGKMAQSTDCVDDLLLQACQTDLGASLSKVGMSYITHSPYCYKSTATQVTNRKVSYSLWQDTLIALFDLYDKEKVEPSAPCPLEEVFRHTVLYVHKFYTEAAKLSKGKRKGAVAMKKSPMPSEKALDLFR